MTETINVHTSDNDPLVKKYHREVNVSERIEAQFFMIAPGRIESIHSSGLTTIQYKINNGTFATPVPPIVYAANDVITFTYAYTDLATLTGNLIIKGKDN
jgi:hypothetical protein